MEIAWNFRWHAAAVAAALFFILAARAFPLDQGEVPSASLPQNFLAGYDAGLYRIEDGGGRAVPLWLDGEVRKIIKSTQYWYFLTSLGILRSADLGVFEDCSAGLPVKTYKRFKDGTKSFATETQDLKDLRDRSLRSAVSCHMHERRRLRDPRRGQVLEILWVARRHDRAQVGVSRALSRDGRAGVMGIPPDQGPFRP